VNREIDAIRAMLKASPRPTSLLERRQRLDALGTQYPMPPHVSTEQVDANGVPAEWTRGPAADRSRVMLFLHGGGYVSGSIQSHRHMVAQAGLEAGISTLALGYRLAPEHPFPAALEDALSAYRYLLGAGIAPQHILLAGESAGGGLALATLISARDAGLPLPACTWLSSPWVDLTMSGATMKTKAAIDPLIQEPYLRELAHSYLGGTDPQMPLVSPINADLTGLPPMLIQVGSAETLLSDAVGLTAVAADAHVQVTLRVWPNMIHAWHLFYHDLRDGRRALAEVGRFARASLFEVDQ
jgi:epsilon-lactone hydrolase